MQAERETRKTCKGSKWHNEFRSPDGIGLVYQERDKLYRLLESERD